MRLLRSIAVVGLLSLLMPPMGQRCHAETYEAKADGPWNSSSTWYKCGQGQTPCDDANPCTISDGYPGAEDDARICRGFTVHVVASEAIDDLEIECGISETSPGVLEIRSGSGASKGELTLNDYLVMQTDSQHGDSKIEFTGTSDDPGELIIDWPVALAGDVTVSGSIGGDITVNEGFTLTMSGTLAVSGGPCTIVAATGDPDAKFHLTGTANVTSGGLDSTGAFEIDGNLNITGSAEFDVKFSGSGIAPGSTGELLLDNSHDDTKLWLANIASVTITGGLFDIVDGTLKVDKEFITPGCLKVRDDGKIDCSNMSSAERFEASGDCSSY